MRATLGTPLLALIVAASATGCRAPSAPVARLRPVAEAATHRVVDAWVTATPSAAGHVPTPTVGLKVSFSR